MIKADEKVLKALVSLEANKDFEVIRNWIEKGREDLVDAAMNTREDVLTRWYQGEYQALNFIIQTMNKARSLVRR